MIGFIIPRSTCEDTKTPPSGKTTIFVDPNDQLMLKDSEGVCSPITGNNEFDDLIVNGNLFLNGIDISNENDVPGQVSYTDDEDGFGTLKIKL